MQFIAAPFFVLMMKQIEPFVLPTVFVGSLLAIFILPQLEFVAHYGYVLMLLLPYVDGCWRLPCLQLSKSRAEAVSIGMLVVSFAVLLVLEPGLLDYFIVMVLTAAFPEEWFFRAYLLSRVGSTWKANVVVSIVFSAMHIPASGVVFSSLVFFPSLAFGWVYLRYRNIYLVILLHAVSNLVYTIYIKQYLAVVI